MLKGDIGAGKKHTAQWVTKELLNLQSIEKVQSHQYVRLISPEKSVVSIAQVRDVKQFMSLKTTGKTRLRRVVCIFDAHLMTVEAQNALLKILEEPPDDSVIVLTVNDDRSLKETIYSRVQKITVLPVSLKDSADYFEGFSSSEVDKFHALSTGYVGLMSNLLTKKTDHPMIEAINTAKKIVTSTTYERLLVVDALSKNKQELEHVLFAIKRIASVGMRNASLQSNELAANKWRSILSSTLQTEANLRSNPNSKLALTNLFLQM